MDLNEMRQLSKEISEKRKTNERDKNRKDDNEFNELVKESSENVRKLKSFRKKERKTSYSYNFNPVFIVLVMASLVSIAIYFPIDAGKFLQKRLVNVEIDESQKITEFTDKILDGFRTDGADFFKTVWARNISRFIVEKSCKRMESTIGNDEFNLKEIHLDRKTSYYSVCYEGPSKKTLTMRVMNLGNGEFSLVSIH